MGGVCIVGCTRRVCAMGRVCTVGCTRRVCAMGGVCTVGCTRRVCVMGGVYCRMYKESLCCVRSCVLYAVLVGIV